MLEVSFLVQMSRFMNCCFHKTGENKSNFLYIQRQEIWEILFPSFFLGCRLLNVVEKTVISDLKT